MYRTLYFFLGEYPSGSQISTFLVPMVSLPRFSQRMILPDATCGNWAMDVAQQR
jgi:hypothetical protein